MVSESELPRYIGPKIKLASTATTPRATHMGGTSLPSEDSPGYASIGPPFTPSNLESAGTMPGPQPGWIADPTKSDSGAPSSDSGDSPELNKNPRSSTANHFVLNSGHPTSAPQMVSPSDCGIYVHPSDIIDGNETTLVVDHTYATPPVNDSSLLNEVTGKGDAEICETNFDSNTSSSTIVAVATISSLQSAPIAQQLEHIRTSKGQLYAVVSKGETAGSKQTVAKDTPADQEDIQPENRELGVPLATSTLKAEGVSRKQPPSPSILKLPPESVKSEQIAELKQLPSIGKKRIELEKRMKGEELEGPTALAPRRPPPEVPHRVTVPQSVQGMNLVGMPTPPPMSTHPGVLKKEVDQKEKKKKRLSKSKRNSSAKEDPPMREPPPPTEAPSGEKAKRRLSGSIATPISLMNAGNEVKETFQNVTRRDWNTTLFEVQPGQVPSTFSTADAVPRTASLTPTLTHKTSTSKDLVSPLEKAEPSRSTLPKVRRAVSMTGHQLTRRSSRNIHDLVPGVKQASSSQQNSLERKKSEDATLTTVEVQEGVGQRIVTETIGRVPVGPMNTKRDVKKRKNFLSRKK